MVRFDENLAVIKVQEDTFNVQVEKDYLKRPYIRIGGANGREEEVVMYFENKESIKQLMNALLAVESEFNPWF